ncbi:hypothetical protein RAJCM14343_4273 [Rhodococcus aetherivorans]|uniref:Secreted protein n=1 Tax=Rhodococcus aetherivorans TaxID=191292 RepID=A0ABQ0YRI7_9NOCA|nr:hypothetical protein RAJCM14343_4273 [Rhodococcus aetherivorans]
MRARRRGAATAPPPCACDGMLCVECAVATRSCPGLCLQWQAQESQSWPVHGSSWLRPGLASPGVRPVRA